MSTETFEQMVERVWMEQPACGAGIVLNFATRLREELAKGQEPVGKVLSEEEMGIAYDRRAGPVIWFGAKTPGFLYTRPFVAAPAGPPDGWEWPDVVREKLARFQECTDDDDAVDIGREWFDALTTIGLLKRTQRSPALWKITDAGRAMLSAAPAAPAAPAAVVAKDAERKKFIYKKLASTLARFFTMDDTPMDEAALDLVIDAAMQGKESGDA